MVFAQVFLNSAKGKGKVTRYKKVYGLSDISYPIILGKTPTLGTAIDRDCAEEK